MKRISEVLTEARDYLTSERWCKGTLCRDAEGLPCSLNSPRMTQVCLQGALEVVASKQVTCLANLIDMYGTFDDYAVSKGMADAVLLNDHPYTTHADIMAAFDAAIAKAKTEEGL